MTSLVLDSIPKLKGVEMLCKEDLDLFDTMSAFECMDPKMDVRMHRKSVVGPKKARDQGLLLVGEELTP